MRVPLDGDHLLSVFINPPPNAPFPPPDVTTVVLESGKGPVRSTTSILQTLDRTPGGEMPAAK